MQGSAWGTATTMKNITLESCKKGTKVGITKVKRTIIFVDISYSPNLPMKKPLLLAYHRKFRYTVKNSRCHHPYLIQENAPKKTPTCYLLLNSILHLYVTIHITLFRLLCDLCRINSSDKKPHLFAVYLEISMGETAPNLLRNPLFWYNNIRCL